jgi:hypothetical protein
MEAKHSEKSVDFQQTTWRYTPEDLTLRNNRSENLKPYRNVSVPAGNITLILRQPSR